MKNKKISVVFLGTPLFSIPALRALSENSSIEFKAAITQPDRPQGRGQKMSQPPVKIFCDENHVPCYQFDSLNSKAGVECLKKLSPDIIVVVSFGQILSQEVLDIPKQGCINAHASLLPKYRGAAPIQWALINGEKETGVTIMKLIKKMDAGPMLTQKKIKIEPDETAATLYTKLSELSAKLLIETIQKLAENTIISIEQNHSLATYAPPIQNENCHIQWNSPAIKIHNLVRGLSPTPAAYTFLNGIRLKIFSTKMSDIKSAHAPGSIEKVASDGIVVNTQDYCIFLTELQLANKKRLPVSQFIQGYHLKKEHVLGK